MYTYALVATLAVVGFGALLLRYAAGLQLVDAPAAAPERKRQKQPIPIVGGSAILLSGLTLVALFGAPPFSLSSVAAPHSAWLGVGLLLAFGVGLIDDLFVGWLSAWQKVVGQLLASLPMAYVAFALHGALGIPVAIMMAITAMNLANTYDNADGALTSLAALALALTAPVVALGVAAFLPLNIGEWGLRRASNRKEPRAYLGDSGSHLLGMLVLLYPPAWGFFFVPALDLARVSILRIRAGRHIWSGDRWHLAHRLEERGLSPLAVLILLGGMAAPAVLAPSILGRFGIEAQILAGYLPSCALFFLAVRASRPKELVR